MWITRDLSLCWWEKKLAEHWGRQTHIQKLESIWNEQKLQSQNLVQHRDELLSHSSLAALDRTPVYRVCPEDWHFPHQWIFKDCHPSSLLKRRPVSTLSRDCIYEGQQWPPWDQIHLSPDPLHLSLPLSIFPSLLPSFLSFLPFFLPTLVAEPRVCHVLGECSIRITYPSLSFCSHHTLLLSHALFYFFNILNLCGIEDYIIKGLTETLS